MFTERAVHARFNLKPTALAVALATGSALAAPTPNQMPGGGFFAQASLTGALAVNGVATPLGSALVNLPNGTRIDVQDKVVLRWGAAGGPADVNPLGFNLGANAQLTFGGFGLSTGPAVLNVDVSGNPSQVYGSLVATNVPWAGCPVCNFAPAIWLANANGIVVGAGGRIVAPKGIGLVGADMNTAVSMHEFVGNNGWVAPAAPTYGASYVTFGATTGDVTIGGKVNGDAVANAPAPYVFVAGSAIDVLNTGNVFADLAFLQSGLTHVPGTAAVNGVPGVSVGRSFTPDSGGAVGSLNLGSSPGDIAIVPGAAGTVVNEGSIAAAGAIETLTILASAGIRSGTDGSTDTLVGLFSDGIIDLNAYTDSGKVELYNVISGYTTNTSLYRLSINTLPYASNVAADVTIRALTPGSQPSSITALELVRIDGGNVLIDSTINHRPNPPGVSGESLHILGTKSVTISASIGAGDDVFVESQGPLTISGNVLSDLDANGAGGIFIENTKAGATTTIAGLLRVPATSNDGLTVYANGPLDFTSTSEVVNLSGSGGIDVRNLGTGAGNYTSVAGHMASNWSLSLLNTASPAIKPMSISGNLEAQTVYIDNLGGAAGNTTTIAGDVSASMETLVTHVGRPTGMLEVTGTLTGPGGVTLSSDGNAQIRTVTGEGIFATVLGTSFVIDGRWTAADGIVIDAPLATTKLKPEGVLAGYGVRLNGLNFTGVNASGTAYADAGEKPDAQIVASHLYVNLTGSINGPIAGNTNWLLNSLDVAPWYTLAPVHVHVSANGGGFQAVNLRVLGDAIVDSGTTRTPFIGVPLTTGGLPAGGIQGNLGSQLIVVADGYLQVMGTPTGSLFGPLQAFQWPGGAVLKAGTTLQTFAPIYNAWTVASPPFGGIFFEAPYIALGGYLATSGTAWANFSSPPVTGDPTVYQVRQLAPNAFGFAATTAFVQNAYSNTVTGGAVCTTTGPTTWVVCP